MKDVLCLYAVYLLVMHRILALGGVWVLWKVHRRIERSRHFNRLIQNALNQAGFPGISYRSLFAPLFFAKQAQDQRNAETKL